MWHAGDCDEVGDHVSLVDDGHHVASFAEKRVEPYGEGRQHGPCRRMNEMTDQTPRRAPIEGRTKEGGSRWEIYLGHPCYWRRPRVISAEDTKPR